jgi:hypothetical protein
MFKTYLTRLFDEGEKSVCKSKRRGDRSEKVLEKQTSSGTNIFKLFNIFLKIRK